MITHARTHAVSQSNYDKPKQQMLCYWRKRKLFFNCKLKIQQFFPRNDFVSHKTGGKRYFYD